MLSRGSRGFGVPDCGLAAHVATQASVEAPARSGTNKRSRMTKQFRSAFIKRSHWDLPHRREIRWTHVHLVHSKHFARLVYEGLRGFDVRSEHRVDVKRVPVLFRFFPAGMSHDVDERVFPSGIFVWYPVADDVNAVVVHHL